MKLEDVKSFEKKAESEEWGAWKYVSDMLDNPDEHGIYPTSKCYEQIHDFVVKQKAKAALAVVDELLGKATTPWDHYNDEPGTEAVVTVKEIGVLRASLSTDQVTEK